MELFGPGGMRGKVNEYPVTPEVALRLGKAIALFFAHHGCAGGNPRVIIGKDTRLSGYMLETALTSGLVSMGMDVFETGPVPTPALAHLTRSICADCGIMISGSHNPASDNGIQLFGADGYALPDESLREIELRVAELERTVRAAGADTVGKAFRIDDARGRYIEFAKSTVKNQSLRGVKAVLDCANGAGYSIAPLILKELGVEVVRTATSPDGNNINDRCGALYPQNLSRLVKEHHADIGIALDGDADRAIFSDAQGNILNGDRIIGLCALDCKQRGVLAKNTIAVSSTSNRGLLDAMHLAGIEVEVTPPGARFVIQKLRDLDLSLGGDQAGHVIFRDYATTGDGIITALHVLSLMKRRESSLAALADFMLPYPQSIINIPVSRRIPLESMPSLAVELAAAEKALAGSGRAVVRYAGNENVIRVLVEARAEEAIHEWNTRLCAAIRRDFESGKQDKKS